MSLIHCLVARNSEIVLAEYTEHDGNFQQISRLLLRKLRKESKTTIEYDNYQFHFMKDQSTEFSFLCLADYLPYECVFAFLNDVKISFLKKYELKRIKMACSYQLQEFAEDIKELMEYYNEKPSLTKSGESISNLALSNPFEVRKIENVFQTEEKINLVAVNSNVLKNNYQAQNYMEKKIKILENYKKFKIGVFVMILCIVFLLLVKFLIVVVSSPQRIDKTKDNNLSSSSSEIETPLVEENINYFNTEIDHSSSTTMYNDVDNHNKEKDISNRFLESGKNFNKIDNDDGNKESLEYRYIHNS